MKKGKLLFLFCLIPLWGMSQEVKNAEAGEKEKIKEIKLSEQYVYAETVAENNLSEAQQNSMDLLRTNVNSIFAERLGMPKEDVEEIWDVIEDKCQNITVKKGDLFRVFTYILKDYIMPGKHKSKLKEVVTEDTEQVEESVVTEKVGLLADALVNDSLPTETKEQILAYTPAVTPEATIEQKTDTVAPATPAEVVEPVAVAVAPVTVVPEPVAVTPAAVAVAPEPVAVAQPVVAAEPEKAKLVVHPLIGELLETKTYKELITLLDKKKEEGALIYGRIKTMKSPEKSYLAIFNKQSEVVTILDKGTDERLNLKTNTADRLKNYGGNGVIWFQIFE